MNELPRPKALATGLVAILVAGFAAVVLGLRTRDATGVAPADRLAEVERLEAGERIRVEVLNGAGSAGLAREATRRLREQGFDVVYFGNAGRFGRDSSIVIDRVGRTEVARRVATALGIARVKSEPDPDLYLEATVVLGLDWPPPPPPEPEGLGARLRGLWRDSVRED